MKRYRKILRKVVWILTGLIILFLILHTPPVKNLFKGILTRTAVKQLNGQLEIGRLSYRLWRGDVKLDDVEIRLPGIRAKAERIEADLFSKQGISLKVEEPEVVLSPKPELSKKKEGGDGPSRPWTFLEKLGTVEINDTRLDWRDGQNILSASGYLKLERQDRRIQGQRQSWILQAGLSCSLNSRPPYPIKISAEVALDKKSLRIHSFRVGSEKNSFHATGIFHHLSPLNGELEGRIQADSTLAEVFNLTLPVQGEVTAQFQLAAFKSKMEGQVELDSTDFILAETGPWSLHGNLQLSDGKVRFERFQLEGYSGSLESRGEMILCQGSGKASILAQGMDLNPLLKSLTDTVPEISTRAGAKINLNFDNWQFEQIKATGEIALNAGPGNGIPLSGKIAIGFDKGLLSFRSENLQIFQGGCRIWGSLDTKGIESKAELSIPASDLEKATKTIRLDFPPLELDGNLNISANLTGGYNDLSASASVRSDDIQSNSQKMSVMADLEWKQNTLHVRSAVVKSDPGSLKIQGKIPLGETTKEWDLSAEMESFDLSHYSERFGYSLSADGSIDVTGPSSNPVGSMNLRAQFQNQKMPSQTFSVILDVQKKGQTIFVEQLRTDIGGGNLTASGSYLTDSGEIKGQLSAFGIPIQEIVELPDIWGNLDGVLSLDGDLSGTAQSPQGRLDINLEDMTLNGVTLPTYSLGLRLEMGRIEFKGSGPEPFLTGFCDLSGSFPLHAELDLRSLPYTALLSAIPTLSVFEDLSASGLINLDLSLKDFSNLKYSADIGEIKGTSDNRSWTINSFSIDGDLSSLRINDFSYQGIYGYLSLEGLLPLDSNGEMDLTMDGRLELNFLPLLISGLELNGFAKLQLQIKGTPTRPHPLGEMSITGGEGNWRGIDWDNFTFLLKGDEKQIRLETFSLKVLSGELEANGHFSLPGSGDDSQIAFEFNQLDVGVLLGNQNESSRPSAILNGEGSLSAKELSLSSLNGNGEVTNMSIQKVASPISLQSPFDWTFRQGHFSHSPIHLVGNGTDVDITFEISTAASPPDWDIQINGRLDTGVVSELLSLSEISFSGSTDIALEFRHRDGSIQGQSSISGGRARMKDPPLTISQIQVQLKAQGQTLEITELYGQISSGNIKGSGELVLDGFGKLPIANMTFTIDRAPLTLSKDTYSVISGEARLQGDSNGYTIRGDIIIPRILFKQEMDATTESLSQLDRQLKLLEGKTSLLDLISLNVTTEIQDLRIENRLARLSAEGALSVSGSLSNPELKGSISIRSGGSLQLRRARIQINEGRIILNNFPQNQLELDIGGFTRISGVFIELRVQGQLDNLQTQLQAPYRSDLTQGDLVMLIMTGRTAQSAASEAGTVAVEGLAGALGDVLQKGVGESVYIDISPDQSFFSHDKDPTTWFSLGKEVLPNIYVIYSEDLGGTRRRGVLGYLPKELPIQLRYIGEDDGRRLLEANHRLGLNFQKKLESSEAKRKPLRIDQLSFEGSSPIADKELRKLVKIKPGNRYDHWKALQGAEKIRTRLIKLGYLSARVEFEATPSGSEQTDVTYYIESGKRISIVWKGDQIKGKIRKDIEARWDSTTPADILAETLRKNTGYALKAQKFYISQVEVSKTENDEEIIVELQIKKGPQGRGLVLQFEGNEILSDEELSEALPSPSKPGFFEMIDGNASYLRNTLRVRYASEGYLQIEVRPTETEYNEQNREYFVTIPVAEGVLSSVSDITWPQELSDARGPNAPDLQLKVGQPFRIAEYIHDRSELNRFYRNQGYPKVQVTGILEPTEDEVSITFDVAKNIQPRVGKIRLAHPGKTHESVVRNAMTLKEGDLILPSEIARSRKRLFDTRVYQSVDIQAVESEENPEIQDLVVDLIEKKDVEVNYGLRYQIKGPSYAKSGDEVESGNYSSLEIGGQVQFLNMFGYANRFGISGYLFGLQQSGRLFFETETFFGLRLPTQVYLSSEVNRELEISGLESFIQKIMFQQYYRWGETLEETRWGDRLRFQWNYSFRHIRLDPFDTGQDAFETDRGSISLSLIGDDRDSFINPTEGSFWSVSTEFARTWLGSEVNFNKFYGQGFLFLSLAENIVWASGLRLGVVPGENPLLIIEDRFKAGGPSTVRGFRLNSLGPKNEKGEPLGGQAIIVFNQELRFPLYKSLHASVFYDTGNIFSLAREVRLSDLRHCAGVGLRYLLPFGPIRFDLAYVLDPQPGEDRYRFILTLGHAF